MGLGLIFTSLSTLTGGIGWDGICPYALYSPYLPYYGYGYPIYSYGYPAYGVPIW